MDSIEVEGNSIDEAIDQALQRLGTTRDRVEIEILSNSTRGFFGIGGRKARVRATLRAPADAEGPAERVMERQRTPQTREPRGPRPARSSADVSASATRASEVLQEIITRLDVPASVSWREDEDEHIVIELTGDSSGVLIGRRGQMLDALEYLLNRVVSRDGSASRIVVDSQNYRTRRREALENLTRRMGEQAKKRGKAVTLNPMSPRDRRIVHLIVEQDPSLSTKSLGTGYFRKLIIIPTGATKTDAR